MLTNECAKIKAGFDFAGVIMLGGSSMQVSEGFALREYAFQLHISEQLAQLFRRRYLRCTGRDLRAGRAGIDDAAQNSNHRDQIEQRQKTAENDVCFC